MRRFALVLCALALGCGGKQAAQPTADGSAPDVPMQGQPDGQVPNPDSGAPEVRNLGSEVPVEIDWILPFDKGFPGYVQDWALDEQGNIFLSGVASGTVDLDPTAGSDEHALGATNAPFVVKLGPDGAFQWARVWTGNRVSLDELQIAVSPTGELYAMSTFNGTFGAPYDLDPTAGADPRDTMDTRQLFIARLAPDGKYLGAFVTTGDGIVDRAGTLAIGPDGALWLTGYFQGRIDLDPSTATTLVRSGTTAPFPRKQFVAQYAADFKLRWAFVPSVRSIGLIQPIDDGGALFNGTYGGGTDALAQFDADLDPGPGVDIRTPGCSMRADSKDCMPQSYFGRMAADGTLLWSAGFERVMKDRANVLPPAASGGPIARPDGHGLVLGTARDTVDFDWGPPENVYTFPWHDVDDNRDPFVAAVSPDGRYVGMSRSRTLRVIDGVNESTWTIGTWSEKDKTYYATGWTQGAVIWPSAAIAGVGRPTENFLTAFDEKGGVRWATGLGIGRGLGGTGAARVRSNKAGKNLLLGTYGGRVDLDFTLGMSVADTETHAPVYLVAFHPKPCADGTQVACKCELDPPAQVSSTCEGGQRGACACTQENPNKDGTIPPRPAPDCGACASGWSCNPTTWLCEDPQEKQLVKGLDHPTEVLDDGTHVYYVLQGRYPRTTAPAEQPAGSVWRVAREGGTPQLISDGGAPAYLTLHGGFVYWAQRGLKRTPVGGDGAVEVVVDEPAFVGPFAVDDNAYYLARGVYVARRGRGATTETSSVFQGLSAIRALLVDSQYVYALAYAGGTSTMGGLYRMSVSGFGGAWQLQARAGDGRAMVQRGTSVYFSDTAAQAISRFDTITQSTTLALDKFLGVVGSLTTDGTSIYFTRYGLPAADTWTGEAYRLGTTDGAAPTLIASSITHASDVTVQGGRAVVAEHGQTRATTTTGTLRAFTIR